MSDLTVELGHGSSGAVIDVFPDYVIKTGTADVGTRVRLQANWLDKHRSSAVPVIFETYPHGYMMERLEEVHPFSLTVADLDAIIGRLARGVWSRGPEVVMLEKAHVEKIGILADHASREMLDFLWDARDVAFDRRQRWCLTHGDPTLDNVMVRMGHFVISDPIPATPAVPDLWAVDLGKILQSLVGFEMVRYGVTPHNPVSVRPQHLLETLVKPDRIRAVYWCVVHLMRAMPYVDDTIHDKLRECAHDAIRLV